MAQPDLKPFIAGEGAESGKHAWKAETVPVG